MRRDGENGVSEEGEDVVGKMHVDGGDDEESRRAHACAYTSYKCTFYSCECQCLSLC